MKKFLTLLVLTVAALSVFTVSAFAEGGEASTSEEQNFFEEAYGFLSDNADKILSALAAVASLALAFTYRRGLIPLLKGGLGTISGAVDRIKEDAKDAENASQNVLITATEKLECAEGLITALSEKLSKIEQELAITKEEERRAADLRLLLGTQIDLLHDIFMSSSLPYYRKEEVGEKVLEMKRALSSSEEEINE